MSEHNFWGRVRDGLKGAVPGIDLMRVENMVQAGTPDVNFCIEMTEGWIELKHTAAPPARASTAVFKNGGLRDEQIVWIHTRVRRGGRVFILAQIGEGVVLLHGVYATKFNDMTLSELGRLARWRWAGSSPDWVELARELIR